MPGLLQAASMPRLNRPALQAGRCDRIRKARQAGIPTQPVKLQSAALRHARRLPSIAGPWQAVMVQASRCARALSVTSTPSSAQRRTWHLRQHVIMMQTRLAWTRQLDQ